MRNATAYGVSPRLRLDIVLNNLVAWAHTTGAIQLLSDGTSWRPLVHIEDIARATLALLGAPPERISGEAFNIGSAEQNYRIRELAEIVHTRLPECEVTYRRATLPPIHVATASTSRSSRRAFRGCRFEWTAERGADELARAYDEVGLTFDDFQGDRYTRLKRLQGLLAAGALGSDLRWTRGPSASGMKGCRSSTSGDA